MKQSRLLEIIREEISFALEASYAGKGAIDNLKKDPGYSTLNSQGKMDAEKELKSGGTVELEEKKIKRLSEKYNISEEILTEMASIKQLKSELEKQGKAKELKAIQAAEKSTLDSLKKDPTITSDGRLKGYVSALKKELKNTHNINLQDLLTKTAIGAEGKFNDDIATNTIEKDAANQLLGKEPGQRGRKSSEKETSKPEPKAKKEDKPKAEKKAEPKKSSTKDDIDDEDKEAMKAAGKDETAKELASTPEEKKVKFNQFLASVKKNKEDKAKVDGILKLAKDKFKFPKSMMDDLKRAAGREVGA